MSPPFPAMTEVRVPPSTNTATPWRYLIGYAHKTGFDSKVIERETPLATDTELRALLAGIGHNRRQEMLAIVGMPLMAGPQMLTFRVPVNTTPSVATNPYRYLITYYGTTHDDWGWATANYLVDFDTQLTDPAHVDFLQKVCADVSNFDPAKTHIVNFTLLAGPDL